MLKLISLEDDVIQRLKILSKKENRLLKNYMEKVLIDKSLTIHINIDKTFEVEHRNKY